MIIQCYRDYDNVMPLPREINLKEWSQKKKETLQDKYKSLSFKGKQIVVRCDFQSLWIVLSCGSFGWRLHDLSVLRWHWSLLVIFLNRISMFQACTNSFVFLWSFSFTLTALYTAHINHIPKPFSEIWEEASLTSQL